MSRNQIQQLPSYVEEVQIDGLSAALEKETDDIRIIPLIWETAP